MINGIVIQKTGRRPHITVNALNVLGYHLQQKQQNVLSLVNLIISHIPCAYFVIEIMVILNLMEIGVSLGKKILQIITLENFKRMQRGILLHYKSNMRL